MSTPIQTGPKFFEPFYGNLSFIGSRAQFSGISCAHSLQCQRLQRTKRPHISAKVHSGNYQPGIGRLAVKHVFLRGLTAPQPRLTFISSALRLLPNKIRERLVIPLFDNKKYPRKSAHPCRFIDTWLHGLSWCDCADTIISSCHDSP